MCSRHALPLVNTLLLLLELTYESEVPIAYESRQADSQGRETLEAITFRRCRATVVI
jgi:hypothetical protein